MDKNAIWKWLILVVLVSWSIVTVTPLKDKVKLGLDLQGGTSYLLEVDTSQLAPEAVKGARERALEVIRNRVDSMGVEEAVIFPETGNNRIVVQIPGLKAEDRERTLKNLQRAAFLEFRMVHPENEQLIAKLFEKGLVPAGYKIVILDSAGPGQRGGKFWKKIGEEPSGLSTNGDARAALRMFHAPSGYELLLMKEVVNEQEFFLPHYVNRRAELTGDLIKDAGFDYQPNTGQPYVKLSFDSKGKKRFAAITTDYAPGGAKNPSMDGRKLLGIVLDGTLYSAPFIREPIHGGEASITGSFSVKEAQDLSIVLRAGSLPAPVNLLEARSVDPTLGQDSIDSGKRASIYGGLAVMIFMLGYYMIGGVIANIALIMNIILLPLGVMFVSGVFSFLDKSALGGGLSLPTLTLPGIAGIVLTAGMAVDANVLIFERMREEQKQGKRFGSVISAGYEKAFSAIFDSNITTVLAGAIMFMLGSGTIRGYAVTLSAGILVSMYTAIVVTRMFFDLLARYTSIQQVKMMSIIKETKIDFISKWYIAATISVIVIAVGIGSMVVRGKDVLGVDFSSGAALIVKFDQKAPVEDIRAALASVGIQDAFIQYQRQMGESADSTLQESLAVKVPFEDGDQAEQILESKFPGFVVLKQDSVDPQVGAEFTKRSIWAVLASLLGMILYISWRFEFSFSMGAVVALFHDVLITVGVYCLLGRQLSLTTIAAVLTIIGFSVNDTIVIFDRIREDMKLVRGRPFIEIANLSINQTLSRTLLTSFTALLSVVALLVFGGGAINDFALTLFIGMISGVYSTVYVATPVVLLWHRKDKVVAK